MIDDKTHEEASDLIKDVTRELEIHFDKIKKSKRFLSKMYEGNLFAEIMVNILANFTLMQLREFSGKAKMVNNQTNVDINRQERFLHFAEAFLRKFEYICNQHLEYDK